VDVLVSMEEIGSAAGRIEAHAASRPHVARTAGLRL